jgi:osmotically-inducible protein OsmY
VTETVRVRKQTQTDKQLVSGVVREESAEIVPISESGAATQGAAPSAQSERASSETAQTQEAGISDDLLSTQVRTSLARSYGGFDGYHHIIVTSRDGEVTLRGDVTSDSEKKALTKRVQEISGVRSVNNELRVIKASEPTK